MCWRRLEKNGIFKFDTDASSVGLRAILSQKQGGRKVDAYASRLLSRCKLEVNLNLAVGRYNSPSLTSDSRPKDPSPIRFLYLIMLSSMSATLTKYTCIARN